MDYKTHQIAMINKSLLAQKIRELQGLSSDEKSQLLGLINDHKRYGLVWEDKVEEVEEQLQEQLPILNEVTEKRILSTKEDAPNHILIEGDNLHALTCLSYTHEGKIDVIYIDPPYNARQYCANYHVLETIARYDSPELKGKTGLRDYSKQKSDFCSPRTVVDAFDDVIRNANFEYIFLSYNNEGLMPFETIREVMQRYGEYEMFSTDYRRFKADTDENRNHKSDKTVEYLHCLIKK